MATFQWGIQGLFTSLLPFLLNHQPACRTLSCHVNPGDDSSCKRLLVPLLDGTECAPHRVSCLNCLQSYVFRHILMRNVLFQWCLKGHCVSTEELGSSVVVHGAWSSWSGFSPCSRTCGGGISHRTRKCTNPRWVVKIPDSKSNCTCALSPYFRPAFGGSDCEGADVEAELCHQQVGSYCWCLPWPPGPESRSALLPLLSQYKQCLTFKCLLRFVI